MTQVGNTSEAGQPGKSGASVGADRWRVLPGWAVFVASGVAFWVVGYLPWIVEGMHVEVSSAWPRFDTLKGPVVGLPFGEYAFQALLVGGVIGGAAALAVSRLASPGVRFPRAIASTGAVIALVAALGQTLVTVRPALVDTDEARLLIGALILTSLGSGLLGVVVGAGVARAKGWPWLLGGAMVASLLGPWLVDVIARNPADDPQWLMRIARWHPWVGGIALGVVLAVFGYRPAARLVGWLVALAIAWVLPSALTAMSYVTYYGKQGTLSRDRILEVADAGRDVFVQSLQPSNHHIGPLVLAVVIGIAGATSKLRGATDLPA
ncbi:hypothetical protein [Janibacter sp. HTCC2649]|uniref:hypothetical protein n=1 Tax=Janibacter sp. HTCC2649 TaxID=313589 RepID=UPI000320E5D1|nr:hypothetical protein [Janibacter sp. HTCC2649]